jgi:hypothetical protein
MAPKLEFLIKSPAFVPGGKKVKQALDRAMFRAKSGSVLYTDTSPVQLFSVPAYTLIWSVIGQVVVGWTGTSPTNAVGDGTLATRFLATTDFTIATPALYRKTTDVAYEYTADDTIDLTIGGSALATGETKVWVLYIPASNREIGS